MELTLTGDLAKQILAASREDSQLEEELAKQYLSAIDPYAMAAYLLTRDVAISLLSERLRDNPEQTIAALQTLPGRDPQSAPPARAKRAAKRAAPRRKVAKKKSRAGGRRRRRLAPGEADALKQQVTQFLARNGWSTRKELTAAVPLDTQAIYRRIMNELQQAGIVVSKGEKSKARYGLKDGRAKGAARKGGRKKRGS